LQRSPVFVACLRLPACRNESLGYQGNEHCHNQNDFETLPHDRNRRCGKCLAEGPCQANVALRKQSLDIGNETVDPVGERISLESVAELTADGVEADLELSDLVWMVREKPALQGLEVGHVNGRQLGSRRVRTVVVGLGLDAAESQFQGLNQSGTLGRR